MSQTKSRPRGYYTSFRRRTVKDILYPGDLIPIAIFVYEDGSEKIEDFAPEDADDFYHEDEEAECLASAKDCFFAEWPALPYLGERRPL